MDHGRVTGKHLGDGDRPAVDLDLWGRTSGGETTTPGHATILLPSREYGEVRLPEPPGGASACQEALDALADRFAAEEHVKPTPSRRPGSSSSTTARSCGCASTAPTGCSAHRPDRVRLIDLVDAAASDEGVQVVHLTGSGDDFCSGFDLGERTPARGVPGWARPPAHARTSTG